MSYAEGTSVPVERSKAELETIVRRHGGYNYGTATLDAEGVALAYFTIGKDEHRRMVRIRMPLPKIGDFNASTRRASRRGGAERARRQNGADPGGLAMKRWKCPLCSSGVLAPVRPVEDDVRRYCLSCSARTGRLVRRICPAQETQRKARADRRSNRRTLRAVQGIAARAEPRASDDVALEAWRPVFRASGAELLVDGAGDAGGGVP